MFYVFEVYHKHGAYGMESFESEGALRSYLSKYIEGWKAYDQDADNESDEDDLTQLSLSHLIRRAKIVGSGVREHQVGYGVVSVIHGFSL
jgi:hypothetical protein